METAVSANKETLPSYEVVVTAPGATLCEPTLRAIVRRQRAKLYSLVNRGPQRAHLRLATTRVYDVVIALEAVGMEVVRVVSMAR